MKEQLTTSIANAGIGNSNQKRDYEHTEEQSLITGIGQPDYGTPLEVPQNKLTDSLIAKVNVSRVVRFRGTVHGLL